ncbi:DUF4349 domain-containing protein [Xylanivirga thermophila]|uniref:DUF4349 domain-containing protein n=1 Tax=Xylanivirga thermophila TaxID=2496273 RepID=UPI00101C4910|nr:DUF4349 domain-containing protein [Xylanivirga thermophila]
MRCSVFLKRLSLYVDKRLPHLLMRAMDYHIKRCQSCREEYKTMLVIRDMCRDLPLLAPPNDFSKEIRKKLLDKEIKGEYLERSINMGAKRRINFSAVAIAAVIVIVIVSAAAIGSLSMVGSTKKDIAYEESKQNSSSTEMVQEDKADKADKAESPADDAGFSGDRDTASSSQSVAQIDRKLIKYKYLTMETIEFDRTIDLIYAKVESMGGYVETSNVEGKSRFNERSNEDRSAHFEIRVPSNKLEQFTNSLGDAGDIIRDETGSEDITGQYFDTEARLKSLQIQEERLLTILTKAEKLQDIIELERELSTVRYEIENLTGTLKKWDNLVDYSRVTLDVYQVKQLSPGNTNTFYERVRRAFSRSVDSLIKFFQNIAIGMVVLLPYIPLILLVIWIIRKLYVKRVSNKKNEEA